MAKPKHQYRITPGEKGDWVIVYTLNAAASIEDLRRIEGVSSVLYLSTVDTIIVNISPLYDQADIVAEITDLLSPSVPDAFNEAFVGGEGDETYP